MNPYKIFAISIMISSLSLFADEGDQVAQSSMQDRPNTSMAQPMCCPVCVYDHRVQVGANYTYAWVTPDDNATTTGSLGGAQGIYEYRPQNWLYAAVAFNYRQGNTKKDAAERSILDLDTQERFGYTYYDECMGYRFALFAGFGGRYMSEEVSSGSAEVTFNYVHFYIPVGFLADYEVNSWLNWGLNFQWKPQVYPTVQIKPLDGARWMLTKHIDNFVVDMPITYKYSSTFSVIVDPFFELWHDGKSFAETATGLALDLPGNRYYFTGVNVNLAWNF